MEASFEYFIALICQIWVFLSYYFFGVFGSDIYILQWPSDENFQRYFMPVTDISILLFEVILVHMFIILITSLRDF